MVELDRGTAETVTEVAELATGLVGILRRGIKWLIGRGAKDLAEEAAEAAERAARHTPDQRVLKELVDEATMGDRKPLSRADAEMVLDWADEVGYPGARATPGDVASPSNWTANPVPHIFTDAAIDRFRWHAGLQESAAATVPSIAACTWAKGRVTNELQQAVADCLKNLAILNREVNGEVPSAAVVRVEEVPRSLVYAMAEIVRMLRECQELAREQPDGAAFASATWQIETAWPAVLAGDIDDILKHVEEEEAARFQ